MFRLGGSTSGITSGLDTPKRGRVDGPGRLCRASIMTKPLKPLKELQINITHEEVETLIVS